jgi:PHD/YefM family antitoxin component YafN of YafNO toxin-antitoxin module
MTFTLSSSEAQQNFDVVMDQALAGTDVIVERDGVVRVTMLGYQRYQQLVEAERTLLRLRLQQASAASTAAAAHLSDQEIDALIEEAREEAHQLLERR